MGVVIGLFFLVTGVAKLFDFSSFVYSITQLLPGVGALAPVGAVGVVSVDILCGLGLIVRRWERRCSGVLAMLLGLFIGMLSYALMQGVTVSCSCFGMLGLSFPIATQIVVDGVLLNITILMLVSSTRGTYGDAMLSPRGRRLVAATLLITVFWSGLMLVQAETIAAKVDQQNVDLAPLHIFWTQHHGADQRRGPRLFVLVDQSDFRCQSCFQDFMELIDAMASIPVPEYALIILMRRDTTQGQSQQIERLRRWQQQLSIPYPLIVDQDALYE